MNNYRHVDDSFIEKYGLWDYRKLPDILEHNNVAILFGGRNTAKSTGVATWLCDEVIYKGLQFVYLVRGSDQTRLIDYFSQVDDRIEYRNKQFILHSDEGRETVGYCVALSQEEKVKSQIDFSKVAVVIYEEFTIIDPDKYLAEEVTHLASLLSTIKRFRQIKLICVGNNNTRMNCYNPLFEEFGLDWDKMNLKQGDSYTDTENGIYLEFVKNSRKAVEENLGILKAFKSYTAVYGDFAKDPEIVVCAVKDIEKKEPLGGHCFKVREGKFLSYYSVDGALICRSTDKPTKYPIAMVGRTKGLRVYNQTIKAINERNFESCLPLRFYSYEAKYLHTMVAKEIREATKLR